MSSESGARKGSYMISAVAELYEIHPQTLRMYEREGLLQPSRSSGNTRLYDESDLQRLEVILSLTRDLGVNLAGVEVILNMRRNMERLQAEMVELIAYVRDELLQDRQRGKSFSFTLIGYRSAGHKIQKALAGISKAASTQ